MLKRSVPIGRSLPGSVGCRWGLSQSERSLTRSMWYLCRPHQQTHNAGIVKPAKHTERCQCCGLHTEGDKAIAQFLKEEIKLEQKLETKLPSIKGFELTSSDSSDVEFTKTDNNEIIKVKFNINNSVSDMEPQDENQTPDQAVPMISRPPFIIELTKGDQTFALSMSFPEGLPEGMEEQGEDNYEDEIVIDSVAMLKKGQEWDEKVFTLQGHNMDGTLYDMLLDMLDERGITDKFLDEMVAFSTSYEQQKYVSFLNSLKNFCSGS